MPHGVFTCPACGSEHEDIEFSYVFGARGSYFEPDDPDECDLVGELPTQCQDCELIFDPKVLDKWVTYTAEGFFETWPGDSADEDVPDDY